MYCFVKGPYGSVGTIDFMDSWWNFFYFCGSAAATLTGLMFIAVPSGSALIKKDNLAEVDVFFRHFAFTFCMYFFSAL